MYSGRNKIKVIGDEIFYFGEKVATFDPSTKYGTRQDFIHFIENARIVTAQKEWEEEYEEGDSNE